jgi:hypothetical protein
VPASPPITSNEILDRAAASRADEASEIIVSFIVVREANIVNGSELLPL